MGLRIAPLAAVVLTGLAGVNVALAIVIAARLGAADDLAVPRLDWALTLPSTGGDNMTGPEPLTAWRVILQRPVFFRSRAPFVPTPPLPPRPPKPAAPPAAKVAAPPPVAAEPAPPAVTDPGLTVGGIVIADGVRKAWLFGEAASQGKWLAEGEAIAGWTVTAIDGEGVSMGQGDHTIELRLYARK